MSGLLQTIESPAGQTIGLIRENGQVEDCLVVPGGSSIGGTGSAVYFVDRSAQPGGNGSIDAPFQTFAAAFAAAAADVVTSFRPQTIWCTPGVYAEPPQASASPGFTLTVVGWNIGGSVAIATTPDVGPTLPNITLTGAGTLALNLIGCNIGTASVATGQVTLQGSVASQVTCDVLSAIDSQVGAGGITATTSADCENCVLVPTGTYTIAFATFRNCPRPAAPFAVTGSVQLDAFTNAFQAITASVALTVLNRPGQATISVVVPAVAAGDVGYVTTALTGELALLPQDAPIVGNPTADLVAAGAGGGFINCRVSSAGNVRCAFLGPLAGGASNFTFSAL